MIVEVNTNEPNDDLPIIFCKCFYKNRVDFYKLEKIETNLPTIGQRHIVKEDCVREDKRDQ